MLLCTNRAGGQKLAAWTLGEPHEVSLEMRLTDEITAVSGNGQGLTPKIAAGCLVLELKAAPQYVTLAKARLRSTSSPPGAGRK